MNDLKLDYTKKSRHTPQIKRLLLISGMVMIGLSLAILVMVLTSEISLALIIPALANTLVGIHFILQSAGHKLVYPRKYFQIDSEAIKFKLGGFLPEKQIKWDSITRISDEGKFIHIYSGDQVTKISMLHFPSIDEKRIKEHLKIVLEARGL